MKTYLNIGGCGLLAISTILFFMTWFMSAGNISLQVDHLLGGYVGLGFVGLVLVIIANFKEIIFQDY
jgi:hypothetical protein